MNIPKLKQNPETFARLFGIAPDKFDELVVKAKPVWLKMKQIG